VADIWVPSYPHLAYSFGLLISWAIVLDLTGVFQSSSFLILFDTVFGSSDL